MNTTIYVIYTGITAEDLDSGRGERQERCERREREKRDKETKGTEETKNTDDGICAGVRGCRDEVKNSAWDGE